MTNSAPDALCMLLSSHSELGQPCEITLSAPIPHILITAHHSTRLLQCICGSDDVVLCCCALQCCYRLKEQSQAETAALGQKWVKRNCHCHHPLTDIQEEAGEGAGDGYGIVCSFSVLCHIFKWTTLTVHTPLFLWHCCDIGINLINNGKICSCVGSTYGHTCCVGWRESDLRYSSLIFG